MRNDCAKYSINSGTWDYPVVLEFVPDNVLGLLK